jgi:hypothetical protein
MAPRPLLPDDDLYARLEVPVDASAEVIEIAWRALLRRHHPDVAGADGLAAAKAINVAHDWLSDRSLRERYDQERGIRRAAGAAAGGGTPWSDRRPGATTEPVRRRPRVVEDPAVALQRFLERLRRLSADDLDRLDCADATPIAFIATIERFLSESQLAAISTAETAVEANLPPTSWRRPAVRDAVLGPVYELVLGPFLDENLDEPFRGRVRERLTRGWDAAVGKPRYGPNGPDVEALVVRIESLDADELRAVARAGATSAIDDEPWPSDATPEDDEALRVSSVLAARDASLVLETQGLDRASLASARRAVRRVAHLLVLRHAFPVAEWERLAAPWRSLLIPARRSAPASVRQRG